MRRRYLNYNLENGYINNWLVAGPQAIPVDLSKIQEDNFKSTLAQEHYEHESGIRITPVERGPLTKGLFKIGDYQGSWEYIACKEDHQVDLSGTYHTPKYLRAWAYTQLTSKSSQGVLLVLTTHGPADLWLNGEHIHRQTHFSEQHPESDSVAVTLKNGVNKILIRFETVAILACPYALALQIRKPKGNIEPYPPESGIHVTLPTLIEDIKRRNKFEKAMVQCFTGQEVYQSQERIRLFWPQDLQDPSPAVVRLQTEAGQIHAEATVDGTPGDELFLHSPHQIPPGPYRIRMLPLQNEFYDHNMRITHEIPLWNLGRAAYSAKPYGTFEKRRQEALLSASKWPDRAIGPRGSLFSEIAKMALDRWDDIHSESILDWLSEIELVELLGIIGMVYRFGDHAQFPKTLLDPIEETILNFPYRHSAVEIDRDQQSQQILSFAVELLAGGRFPKNKFDASGRTGQWHRQHGEEQVLKWLYERGAYGFSAWDSQAEFVEQLIALSHLVDLAKSEAVRELSTALMDKLFATMAINSYQGVFGSTQGQTSAPFAKGGLLEPTSGICRLMWGSGTFNQHIAGTVSLACLQSYDIPPMIQNIATVKPNEIWHHERHAVNLDQSVNKVTYRTADGMLCSAQDYCPGGTGRHEHIWQATLGEAATVFVNHPACSSESDARQPNFWAGNAILPRVAQWKDVLLSIHQIPQEDWIGFTHAYFPIYAFDEYAILEDHWAFARKGNGYLALTASAGFQLIQHGQYAYRELRSNSLNNIWICHLGRKQLDGDFQAFQQKVLALPIAFNHDSVTCTTLRNETLALAWEGPFLRDGQQQALSGFKHYDSPFINADYPCKQMDIAFGEDLLRLNFEGLQTAEAD